MSKPRWCKQFWRRQVQGCIQRGGGYNCNTPEPSSPLPASRTDATREAPQLVGCLHLHLGERKRGPQLKGKNRRGAL